MLEIVGGIYREICAYPYWDQFFGSGLRGAIALSSGLKDQITLHSCIGKKDMASITEQCRIYGIKAILSETEQTTCFQYFHPLSQPTVEIINSKYKLDLIKATNILFYGFAEASVSVEADYLVYDPQNWERFSDTGSKANHLALVLNANEAYLLSGLDRSQDLNMVGQYLLKYEGADVVVIKNAAQGALVIENNSIHEIGLFETNSVWPIGSGDVFSAAFAWRWAVLKEDPLDAANFASQCTAGYCNGAHLPIPLNNLPLFQLPIAKKAKAIYLAGPFFSISQRWLIEEARHLLTNFGSSVFSPLHDVGDGPSKEIVPLDLKGIDDCDVVFAILNGLDPGTIFETGYAIAKGKKVIIFAENVTTTDLVMFKGTDCEIVTDFATAIYKAAW